MSNALFETSKALADIATVLDSQQIEYYLVGSFASGIYGEFRATNDIDLVCRISEQKFDSFLKALSPLFVCDDVALRENWERKRSYNILHEETYIKIDLFFKISPLEDKEFERANRIQIPGTEAKVSVSTVEYNILAKLRWYKESRNQLARQLEDVRSMIALSKDSLDMEYLTNWSESLSLTELLEQQMT